MTQIKRRTIVEGEKYTWSGDNQFFENARPYIIAIVNGGITGIDLLNEVSSEMYVAIMDGLPGTTFTWTKGEYTIVGSKPMWIKHADLIEVFLRGAQVHVKKQEPGMFGPMLNPKRLELIRDYEYHISWPEPEKPREKVVAPYTEVEIQGKRLANLPIGSTAIPGAELTYVETPAIDTKAKLVFSVELDAQTSGKALEVDRKYDLIAVPHKGPLEYVRGDEAKLLAIKDKMEKLMLTKNHTEEDLRRALRAIARIIL